MRLGVASLNPQAEEEYNEEMRQPSAGGAGGGARCCRCGVVRFGTLLAKMQNMMTRHATHPSAVPVVVLDAEGGSGWGVANSPLDVQWNHSSNPRR